MTWSKYHHEPTYEKYTTILPSGLKAYHFNMFYAILGFAWQQTPHMHGQFLFKAMFYNKITFKLCLIKIAQCVQHTWAVTICLWWISIYRKRLHLYLFKLQLWQNYSIYVWLDRVSLSFYSVCFVPLLQISHPSRTEHDQSNKIIRIPIQVGWSQTFHGLLYIELISITYNIPIYQILSYL